MIKHDAATARTSQPFQTWSVDGAAPTTIDVPVDVKPYAYPPNCADVPELFAAAPCCAVTAAPLFSADECAFIIDEAERKDGWVPQEFRYARDVVQQCEDLRGRATRAACRDSLFPSCGGRFPRSWARAPRRAALRVFDSECCSTTFGAVAPRRSRGTLLTCVIALNSLDGMRAAARRWSRSTNWRVGRVCTCGRARHGGAAVRERRYALVVFVDDVVFEPARALANEATRSGGDLRAAAKLYDHANKGGPEQAAVVRQGPGRLEKGQFSEARPAATTVDITPSHGGMDDLGVALAKGGRAHRRAGPQGAATAFQTAAALDEREPAPLSNPDAPRRPEHPRRGHDAFTRPSSAPTACRRAARGPLPNLGCALGQIDALRTRSTRSIHVGRPAL